MAVLYRFPGCGLGPGSTRLAVCAAFGVLLVAASIFPLSVAARAGPAPADESVALCSELSERRDRLHAEIARLHAETAVVEAELALLCTERSNQTDVGQPPLLTLPSHSSAGTADQAIALHQIAQSAQRAAPARRVGKDEIAYSVHCWAPNSTFTDPACNCLGEPAHPKLGSRRTIKILLPSWYGRCASCRVMPQACFARVPAGHASALSRPGAALDAFLLKIVVEERLGYTVQLLSDGQLTDIGPGLRIPEKTSVVFAIYSALAGGEVDMHPEVIPVVPCRMAMVVYAAQAPNRCSIRCTGVAVLRGRGVRRVRPS